MKACTKACIYACTSKRTHTHTHTHTQTNAPQCLQIHKNAHIQPGKYALSLSLSLTHTHTHTHAQTHKHTHKHTHTHTQTNKHDRCRHTCTPSHTHKHTHQSKLSSRKVNHHLFMLTVKGLSRLLLCLLSVKLCTEACDWKSSSIFSSSSMSSSPADCKRGQVNN